MKINPATSRSAAAGPATPNMKALKPLSPDQIETLFATVGQKLREGLSGEAERLLIDSIHGYSHAPDNLATLKRLLSFTLETVGRYKESLEVLKPFEDGDNLEDLRLETQIRVSTQLAIAYNNLTDQPKAVTLLKENLVRAAENDLVYLSGVIETALARVYRKLSEYPICRDYAEKALNYFRENGDWLGMAEAYREIANSYHQEGNSEKALDNFELGIQIIGDNSAPFMLGKLYTDMSGAYWFLRRPQEGIACLEKSIEFFERTEHALNSVIAYNNLGINLILTGEWTKAEKMIRRALEIGEREQHVHVAGIYDSLGELMIFRGELDQAEKVLDKAVAFAEERNHVWYRLQSMRNLGRCYLAQDRFADAAAKAKETIDFSRSVGDKHYANMAGLVLAESHLRLGDAEGCETSLRVIEDTDASSDFYVLGNIQRIRGLAALAENDAELAVHHFNRSLTIFEAAGDLYHTAQAHFLLGKYLDDRHSKRASNHLTTAEEAYHKLSLKPALDAVRAERARRATAPVGPVVIGEGRTNSVVSQLLTVRLAEATASRELLFRELAAVLQQESKASRIVIAQPGEGNLLQPFVTHGYSPQDSIDLIAKLRVAEQKNEISSFSRTRNIAVLPLRCTAGPGAFLLINPLSGAVLADGSSLQPLVRVVELGMDVIALREKDKSRPMEAELSPYASNSVMPGFIHSSPAMTALVEEVYKIRSSDVTVLVTGDSGTGKELVSRAIHTLSNRKDKIFVPFNCTAVPKELAEGHLFGYKKGAFTGAVQDSPGVIRTADGGTLFLDEVGDLPLDVQPKLLRFLQEGEIQPLGAKQPMKVDVRIIAATNMPLEEKVAGGTFREDLYYRLNVIRLRVPPLRERRSEIPPIISYYINHYSARFGKHDITFTPQTIDLMMVCNWDGNVRQLCNEVQRIIARAVDNEVITPEHLSPELKRSTQPLTTFGGPSVKPIASYERLVSPFSNISSGSTLEEAVSELEMQLIRASLAKHNWNISRVADELGITRRGLYLKIARYGIAKAA